MSPRSKISVFVQIILGMLVSFVGLLGTGLGLVAILDPVGTKMADDADPFGTPPSLIESALFTLVFAVITGVGFLVIWLADRKRVGGS